MAISRDHANRDKNGQSETAERKSLARWALDLLLPPQCLLSSEIVGSPGELQAAAWRELHFLDDPLCPRCGVPFAIDPGPGIVCASCLARPPYFDCARAALVYDDFSSRLVLDLKFRDRLNGIKTFATWMSRAGGSLFNFTSIVVPVPLHFTRLVRRRFNQSALLASRLAALAHKPFIADLLVRNRRTPSQRGLSLRARQRNVADAFSVRDRYLDVLENQNIVLVDDVFTTGATVEACAKTLKNCGASRVDVLTLARVVSMGQRLT